MSNMIELVEQMRARLDEVSANEQRLLRALAETLSRVDQKLLADVRSLSAEHDARRGQILHELQDLALRMGSFPAAREPAPAIVHAEPQPVPIAPANANEPSFPPSFAAPLPATFPPAFRAGDWRQAASNIEDELDLFCKVPAAAAR